MLQSEDAALFQYTLTSEAFARKVEKLQNIEDHIAKVETAIPEMEEEETLACTGPGTGAF